MFQDSTIIHILFIFFANFQHCCYLVLHIEHSDERFNKLALTMTAQPTTTGHIIRVSYCSNTIWYEADKNTILDVLRDTNWSIVLVRY